MKKYFLFIICLMLLKCAGAQVSWPGSSVGTTKTLADTTVFYSARIDGRGNEVIIRNRTKDTLGLLTNIGQGLTSFKRSKLYLDSFLIIGNDTILIHNHIDTSGGGLTIEHDPIWYRASIPARRSLDTAYTGNPAAVIRDSIGGGLFHLVSKVGLTIDSGIIFASSDTTRYWMRDRSQSYGRNVRWYGAVGDGVHDDREAILRCIRSIPKNYDLGTQNFGDVILFPRGKYRCSDSIMLDRPVRIVGEGQYLGTGTQIIFDSGRHGFVVMDFYTQKYDSLGNVIDYGGNVHVGKGAVIEHMGIVSRGGSRGIGVWAHAECFINDVVITGWSSMGVFECASGTGGIDSTRHKLFFIYVTNEGSTDYTSPPTVNITPRPSGSGAVAHAVLGYGIGPITVTDSGDGYVERPVVWIQELGGEYDEGNVWSRGYGAKVIPSMGLQRIAVTNSGTSPYTFANVTITGGDDSATATAVISGGKIIAINVINPGSAFTVLADAHVTITGDGAGATAKASSLKVVRLPLITRGKNYEAFPHVYFIGGRRNTGHDAAGVCDSFMNGRVKRVVIDNRGSNTYFTPPVISFAGGGGAGALAFATTPKEEEGNCNRWKIQDTRIDNNGFGLYVKGPDANAGGARFCDMSTNDMCGIWDESFLGNSYYGIHTNGNLLQPWISLENTSSSLWENCYAEGNQQPIAIVPPAKVVSGNIGVELRGSPKLSYAGGSWGLSTNRTTQTTSFTGQFLTGGTAGILQYLGTSLSPGEEMRWKFDDVTTDQEEDFSDLAERRTWMITGPYTQHRFGRTDTVPYAYYIPDLMLGSNQNPELARQLGMSTVFPPVRVSGTQKGGARGDFVINTTPTIASDSSFVWAWQRARTSSTDSLGSNKDWIEMKSSIRANFWSTPFDQTFANTDLTATANRLHHFKGFSLTIDSLGFFRTNSISGSSNREYLYRGFVTDAGNDQVFFANSTSANGQFNPTFGGHTERTNGFISFTNYVLPAQDKDTIVSGLHNPFIRMIALTSTSGSDPINGTITTPVNRRLFAVNAGGGTNGVDVFTVDHDGAIISNRYKNNVAEDSMLTTDVNGRFKMRSFSSFDSGGGTTLSGVQGDIIYFSATNTVANLAKSTTATRYLSNTGTSNNPVWAQINLSNGVNNILPMSSGGTGNGAMSTAAGGIFYTDGTKFARLAAGTSGQVLVTHGAGFAPSWMTMSTGTGGDCDETDPLSIHNQSTLQSAANFNIDGNGSLTNLDIKAGGSITMNSADGLNQATIVADDFVGSQTFRLPSVSNGYFIIGYMSRQFLDFPSTLNGGHSSITITVTGADSEDGASVGCDNPANWPDGSYYTAHGIGAGLVRITFFNFTGITVDPVGEFYNTRVLK